MVDPFETYCFVSLLTVNMSSLVYFEALVLWLFFYNQEKELNCWWEFFQES